MEPPLRFPGYRLGLSVSLPKQTADQFLFDKQDHHQSMIGDLRLVEHRLVCLSVCFRSTVFNFGNSDAQFSDCVMSRC
jgi:hypothetical protein